jgi:hypothetical protein
MEPTPNPFDHIVNPYFTPNLPLADGNQPINQAITEILRRARERQEIGGGPMPQVLTGPMAANYNPLMIDNRQIYGPNTAGPILDVNGRPVQQIDLSSVLSSGPLIIDEDLIRGLLTRDFVSRKIRQWRLLTAEEMQLTLTATQPYLHDNFRDFEYGSNLYVVARINAYWNQNHTRRQPEMDDETRHNWLKLQAATINRLDNNYPLITALLEEYHGRLIAAGGAINWYLHSGNRNNGSDIDLFFIDPNIESATESDSVKQERATTLLLNAVSFLVDTWLNRPPIDEEYANRLAYVFRGEFVTTVYLHHSDAYEAMKYQFIHRVYPNIGSVLGGFDLGPAMIAYTGRKIVATELGAWSALAKTIIVDTSRRSTSFEHRLTKYAKFCHVIFPGLASNTKPLEQPVEIDEAERLLHETIHTNGYHIGQVNDNPYGGQYDFVSNEGDKRAQRVIQILHETAIQYGYQIDNSNLRVSKIAESSLLETIDDQKISNESLKILLVKLAHELGYELNLEAMFENYSQAQRHPGAPWRNREGIDPSSYLKKRESMLRLVKLEIAIPSKKKRYAYAKDFNLRPRRDNQYEVTSDYDGDIVVWPTSNDDPQPHDYGDSPLWPEFMIAANLTLLKDSRQLVAPVVAICAFKNSATPLPQGEPHVAQPDFKQASIAAMQRSFVNVDKEVSLHNRDAKSKVPTTSRQTIVAKLLDSINHPQIGNFDAVYETYNRASLSISEHFEKDIEPKIEPSRLNLVGVRWIIRNPGTQWTSSINPIVAHPRDWYGPYYRSFRLGDEAVETCLRLMRLRPGNPFSIGVMPRDVFRLLLISLFSS